MSDMDKQYINYNLSLVDPQNIEIEPLSEDKEDIFLDAIFKDEAKIIQDLSSYALDEQKIIQDLSSYALDEQKNTGEDGVDVLKEGASFADFGLAREYPLEEIDGDFKTHILNKNVLATEGNSAEALNSKKSESMREIDVTSDEKNGGKNVNIEATPIYDLGGASPEIEVKILKPEGLTPKTEGAALKTTEAENFNNVSVSNGSSLKENNLVDFMNLSPYLTGPIAKIPYSDTELSYDDVFDNLKIKEQTSNLGSMHVYPSNPGGEGGISDKYEIPFEFNPNITESGASAKFEATSLLSRIGDIQSYIKTDGSSVQITTKYMVLSLNQENNLKISNGLKGDHQGNGTWMDAFHLRNIQSIEMAYRGLVYPQLSKKGDSFFRPPLVKIVFDKKLTDEISETPFSNLLTYPYHFSNSTKVYHKSFIVTKVDIKKDWENTPVILNKTNDGILDLQGFEVSLDLIEVDPMYIGILPSFEDYYSISKEYK